MSPPLEQHQTEIHGNLGHWRNKPLLQQIYPGFYRKMVSLVDPALSGMIVEVGSGIGNLKQFLPGALTTDLFPNPWLDLVCDGYEMPLADASVSHLVALDVFHHLEAPAAFLKEARRILTARGRIILFEPFISVCSYPFYGIVHHEPVAWRRPINLADHWPRPRQYYSGQGNSTRLFFRGEHPSLLEGWTLFHAEAMSAFHYLLSGGYSRPALYPARFLPVLQRLDARLNRWPRLFGARCLVGLEKKG